MAAQLCAVRPLSLDLDVDVIRGLLGAWIESPMEAGLAARSLAIAMAETHLASGKDVVVPQFIAMERFAIELADAARRAGGDFVEVGLMMSRSAALQAFAARSRSPENQQHRDAADLVDRSGAAVGAMFDSYVDFLARRPSCRVVEVVRGDIGESLRRVEAAIIWSADEGVR